MVPVYALTCRVRSRKATPRVRRRFPHPKPPATTCPAMRLFHVTDTFLPKVGGAEIAIDQLVRAMNDLGDQCAVVAQRPRGLGREINTPYPLFRYVNPRSSLWAGWWIERRLEWINRTIGPFEA